MNQDFRFILTIFPIWIGAWLFSACSNLDGQCLIKGQFTNMSEGELYFYMPEGPREKIDTVTVREGKFTYAISDPQHSYSILLFPNMSEQVVFVEPDLKVQIEANATQLKDIKITGGNDNKLMTEFRTATRESSATEIREKVLEFIQQHPSSLVSNYLLRKHLLNIDEPDLALIQEALAFIAEAQPQLVNIKNLQEEMRGLADVNKGNKAPDFTVVDNEGKPHTLAEYKEKDLLLIFGATWAEGYREQLRDLKEDYDSLKTKPEVVNILLDYTRPLLRSIIRDSIPGIVVPDKRGWKSEVVQKYHIKNLPTYILIDKNQQIVEREDQWSDIKKQIE